MLALPFGFMREGCQRVSPANAGVTNGPAAMKRRMAKSTATDNAIVTARYCPLAE